MKSPQHLRVSHIDDISDKCANTSQAKGFDFEIFKYVDDDEFDDIFLGEINDDFDVVGTEHLGELIVGRRGSLLVCARQSARWTL